MSFYDDMRGKVAQTSQAVAQKANNFAEKTRLNDTISNAENQIRELYEKIGYQVYTTYGNEGVPEVPGTAEFIQQIQGLHQTIETCKAQIESLSSVCPRCGAPVTKEAAFCSACGQKLHVDEEEKPAEEVENMFCFNCGATVAADSIFCTNCGQKLK